MLRPNMYLLCASLVFLFSSQGSADTLFGKVSRGNALFNENNFPEALKKYQEAQVESPADERLRFNLGNAQYKMDQFEAALPEYLQAARAEDPNIRAQSHYNAGNTLYRMGKLEEAVDQYLKALEFDPDDEDTKYNLEFVRNEIRRRRNEQQRRQEQQKEQQKKEQEQKPSDAVDKENQDSKDQQQAQEQQKQQEQQEQHEGHGKSEDQKSRPEQNTEREEKESGESAGGQNAQPVPPDMMNSETVERYLDAVEAESSSNMKDFLRRQQAGQVVAFPKDW